MIVSNPQDALHRGQMYRLLIEIADDAILSKNLIFKGGTCAVLLGRLDRFSVDLDFDIMKPSIAPKLETSFKKIFSRLGLTVKDESRRVLQYYLKYESPAGARNTLKLDAVNTVYQNDIYKPSFLADIQRYLTCQTIETQFAHKLVAVTDRYEKHHSIAGRDMYDIHYFFLNQYRFNKEAIIERTGLSVGEYISKLIDFIEKNVTETVINEDLNMLLPFAKFNVIRHSLKSEVLAMLKGA